MAEKTVLIIGASKGIGRRGVDSALKRGCSVRAMARGAEAIDLEHQRLEKFPGDATKRDDVRRALDGVDAVILAIGMPAGLTRLLRPVTVFSRSTEVLVDAMEASGPKRLVAVTGFGAGDTRSAMNAVEELGHNMVLGRAYADKSVQEKIVERSGLDWTIVRPTILTNGSATGQYKVLVDPESWRNGFISRADVADFLVECALDEKHLHEAPVLVGACLPGG